MTALLRELNKDIYKSRHVFAFISKRVRYIIAQLLVTILLYYQGMLFSLPTLEEGMNFVQATNYFVIYIIIFLLAFSRTIGFVDLARRIKNEESE